MPKKNIDFIYGALTIIGIFSVLSLFSVISMRLDLAGYEYEEVCVEASECYIMPAKEVTFRGLPITFVEGTNAEYHNSIANCENDIKEFESEDFVLDYGNNNTISFTNMTYKCTCNIPARYEKRLVKEVRE